MLDKLLGNPLLLVAGAVVVLIAVGFLLLRTRGKKAEPDPSDQIRLWVASGQFEKAANFQLQRGLKREAYNLLARGEVHPRASKLAEELGMMDKAAAHAEKAQQFDRAAELYWKVQDYKAAAKLYKRVGNFMRAAESLEKTSDADVKELAQAWENACIDMIPKDPNAPPDAALKAKIQQVARRAAESYRKAGDNDRAITFFEMSDAQEEAQKLKGTSMSDIKDRLTRFGIGASSTSTMGAHLGGPTPTVGGAQPSALSNLPHGALPGMPSMPNFSGGLPASGFSSASPGPTIGNMINAQQVSVEHGVIYQMSAPPLAAAVAAASQEGNERYLIKEKLGEGGMAVVYKAIDSVLEREVALKFLPEAYIQNASALKYFECEAKAAARLNHPNIVTIYDVGVMNGKPFISMELLDGEPLDKRLKGLPKNEGLPILDLIKVGEGLLSALEAAHKDGIVHRDIKPSNVMWTRNGLIKLMDFGIARSLDPAQSTVVVGTPYYMSPEQFDGSGIDHRTDLFSTGVTLYELATHRLPFGARSRHQLPPPPAKVRPELPEDLDQIIWHCIQLQAEDRPSTASELLKPLRRALVRYEASLSHGDHAEPIYTPRFSRELPKVSLEEPKPTLAQTPPPSNPRDVLLELPDDVFGDEKPKGENFEDIFNLEQDPFSFTKDPFKDKEFLPSGLESAGLDGVDPFASALDDVWPQLQDASAAPPKPAPALPRWPVHGTTKAASPPSSGSLPIQGKAAAPPASGSLLTQSELGLPPRVGANPTPSKPIPAIKTPAAPLSAVKMPAPGAEPTGRKLSTKTPAAPQPALAKPSALAKRPPVDPLAATAAPPDDPEALLRAYLQSDHDLLARIQDKPEEPPHAHDLKPEDKPKDARPEPPPTRSKR